jgi:leucyl-tRNA synthetase
MPGWAGSSWYFFRYMEDAANRGETFATEEALKYWENVDLYIGGSEHATGHLLYSRFWVKLLKDRGFVNVEEPFKKLINQGMILGTSAFIYRINEGYYEFKDGIDQDQLNSYIVDFDSIFDEYFTDRIISWDKLEGNKRYDAIGGESYRLKDIIDEEILQEMFKGSIYDFNKITTTITKRHVPVEYVDSSDNLIIDTGFMDWYRDELYTSDLFKTNGNYKTSRDVEKMSKSKYNVVNPDNIVADYGADSLRLYEMFLGPLEQYKPWNTAGITGVHGFLKKLWKLYVGQETLNVNDAEPTKDNLKTLHKTIKKVEEDIENFSFNTSVSTFMIAVNELSKQNCTSKVILEPLLILISPYAPHIAEELWWQLGNSESISTALFPKFEASHLVESSKNYPISFNGKMRFTMELPMDMSKDDIEAAVMAHEKTIAQLDGHTPKRVIVVPGKIVNIVG